MHMILKALQMMGRIFFSFLQDIGRFGFFTCHVLYRVFTRPFYMRAFVVNLTEIGYMSLPVVGLTSLFTGAALALQIYAGGTRFNAIEVVPSIVSIGMARELGPVLVGLMIAGRVGAAIAAEIGSMKVTEQIDALKTLSTDPLRYLVIPRLIASIICLPLLVLVGISIGIFGGYLASIELLGFNPDKYLYNAIHFLHFEDVMSGFIKGAVFGGIIALVGCYQGLHSQRGAAGVGRATTKAVVYASCLILASNYIMTSLFHSQ